MVKETSDQSILQEEISEEKVVEEAPEQASALALVQDPVVIPPLSTETKVAKNPQQVKAPDGNSPQVNKFPFSSRFIEDKEFDEV